MSAAKPLHFHPADWATAEFEDITQPTARAIKEHIAKLKKTLGISGGKPAGEDVPTSPTKPKAKATGRAGRKPKMTVKIPDPFKTPDRDDTEKPAEMKDERMDSPMRVSNSSTPSPKSKGKPQAKRRRGSMSDEESSDDEPISIKSEDKEFRGPKADKQTPSPTRSQAPRRAKTERKASWVELSSTEEDEDMGEDIETDDDGKDDDAKDADQGADEAVPDTQLVPETSIMMIG